MPTRAITDLFPVWAILLATVAYLAYRGSPPGSAGEAAEV